MMNLFIPINIPLPPPLPSSLPPPLPPSKNSRISNISSNQSIFNSAVSMYKKEAPTKNGFNDDIIYTPEIESNDSERNKTTRPGIQK